MKTSVLFEPGLFGLKAVCAGSWSEDLEKSLRSRAFADLELNYAKGWKGTDYSFLKSFPDLLSLAIIEINDSDFESIHSLSKLRHLQLQRPFSTTLRPAAFPQLESVQIAWCTQARAIFNLKTLKTLAIWGYDDKNSKPFSSLVNLTALTILDSKLEDITELGQLSKLRFLRLGSLRKLTSLKGLETLESLEELMISTCKVVDSIGELALLKKLKRIALIDDGDISSLKPLAQLPELEEINFAGSTNIVDGDLSVLLNIRSLRKVTFQNRRHYSHQAKDFSYLGLN